MLQEIRQFIKPEINKGNFLHKIIFIDSQVYCLQTTAFYKTKNINKAR